MRTDYTLLFLYAGSFACPLFYTSNTVADRIARHSERGRKHPLFIYHLLLRIEDEDHTRLSERLFIEEDVCRKEHLLQSMTWKGIYAWRL